MWRPKDWVKGNDINASWDNEDYEAGADAMLEALIKESKEPKYRNGRNGVNVFIPNDTPKENK